ncbi:MAG: hypothetical protein F4079_05415 [Candidatus Dadabacteria bacterium]|nr:hypothetical protein [Candidatus Dadabacteria bacterium]
MPVSDEELTSKIQSQLNTFTQGSRVVGFMLTGFDDDHAHPDGVDFILSSYQPDWIMYPRYYHDTDNAASVFDVIKKHESRRENTNHPLKRLSVRLDKLDQRVFRYLATSFEFELFSPHIEDMDNSNNCSLVLKITGLGTRGFSYLVTGDTETERWDTINRLFGGALKSDIMAAPHHGSKSGCNPETVVLVSPNSVLISAGVDNQYGHPHSEAIAVYQRVAQHVFSTNSDGGQSLLTRRRTGDFETIAMAQE